MPEVIRLEEVKLRGYPQEPQLQKKVNNLLVFACYIQTQCKIYSDTKFHKIVNPRAENKDKVIFLSSAKQPVWENEMKCH